MPLAVARLRQRPCRSVAVAVSFGQVLDWRQYERWCARGKRRCRDRGRRDRRQRGRLFPEQRRRIPRPPHRPDRARPELPRGEHVALGRRRAPAVLDAREHPPVAVHARPVPPPQGGVRAGRRRRLPRAGLPDPGLAEAARACWPRTWRCSSRWAPTSRCWRAGGACAAVSLALDRGDCGRRPTAAPAKAGSIRRASPPCSARRPRRRASRSSTIDVIGNREERRPHRGRALDGRRQDRLRRARQCRGTLGRRAGGTGRRAAPGRAAQALRLCHRLPRGARGAAPGAAHRRSVGRVVPPRGEALPVRQVAGGKRGAAGRRPRFHRPCVLRQRGVAAARRARAGVREPQGGQRLGRLLRHQHARPQRRHRPRTPTSPTSTSPTASPATARSRPPAPATRSPS